MSKLIFLDTNILGMVTNPKNTNIICQECKEWLDALPLKRYQIILPEIADYEVRRVTAHGFKLSL